MPKDDKKKTGATGARICKSCGRAVVERPDGTLMHDRRGRTADDAAKEKDGQPNTNAKKGGNAEKQEEELAPQREHGLMRRIGGKREE